MSLKEHEDNQFTKEKDKVEEYLLRIAHRYFDIENNYTKESIEAIIIESISRLKHFMGTNLNFIKSFNGKTGNVKINLKDFGGESAFNKNSAFNKDFGEAADTICEGNDERLSDSRVPLPHLHQDIDIAELKELIEQCGIIADIQVHDNKSILDMLTYTGANAKIDLILLDYLNAAILEYKNMILCRTHELENVHNQVLNAAFKYIDDLNAGINNTRLTIENSIHWLEQGCKYTDELVTEYNSDIQRQLLSCISKESVNKIAQLLESSPRVLESGEFSLRGGRTAVTTHSVSIPFSQVSQGRIKLSLMYTDECGTTTSTLPFVYTQDGVNIVIQGGYTDSGEIVIKNKVTGGGSSGINSLIGNVKVYYQVIGAEGAAWRFH